MQSTLSYMFISLDKVHKILLHTISTLIINLDKPHAFYIILPDYQPG